MPRRPFSFSAQQKKSMDVDNDENKNQQQQQQQPDPNNFIGYIPNNNNNQQQQPPPPRQFLKPPSYHLQPGTPPPTILAMDVDPLHPSKAASPSPILAMADKGSNDPQGPDNDHQTEEKKDYIPDNDDQNAATIKQENDQNAAPINNAPPIINANMPDSGDLKHLYGYCAIIGHRETPLYSITINGENSRGIKRWPYTPYLNPMIYVDYLLVWNAINKETGKPFPNSFVHETILFLDQHKPDLNGVTAQDFLNAYWMEKTGGKRPIIDDNEEKDQSIPYAFNDNQNDYQWASRLHAGSTLEIWITSNDATIVPKPQSEETFLPEAGWVQAICFQRKPKRIGVYCFPASINLYGFEVPPNRYEFEIDISSLRIRKWQ